MSHDHSTRLSTHVIRALVATVMALSSTTALLSHAHAQAVGVAQILELGIGEQRLLPTDNVESFSEGTKGVADIRITPDGANFLLVGTARGRTTLLLIHSDGHQTQYIIEVGGGETAPQGKSQDNPDHVGLRDNIRLDVYFVQVSDEYSHQLGLSWPSSVGADVGIRANVDLQLGSLTSATAVIGEQVLPRLDMAQATGWAKLLRKAAVITANGTEASFSGGGEINVPVTGGLGGNLQKISYGSQIKVLPRYDRESGRIEIALTADMSDLASDHGTGVPGRSTSQLQAVVNLELSQALVLAGLDSQSTRGSHAGLPWLSQIPILGGLFGSHAKASEQVRNLIFVVPTVVDAVPVSARERIRRALSTYAAFDGDFNDVALLPDAPLPADKGATP